MKKQYDLEAARAAAQEYLDEDAVLLGTTVERIGLLGSEEVAAASVHAVVVFIPDDVDGEIVYSNADATILQRDTKKGVSVLVEVENSDDPEWVGKTFWLPAEAPCCYQNSEDLALAARLQDLRRTRKRHYRA